MLRRNAIGAVVLGALSVGGANTSGAPATRTLRGGVEQREPFTLALTGDSIITQRLSNFIFQNETLLRMPVDSYEQYDLGDDAQPSDYLDARYDRDRRSFPADREYWDSVLATTKWQGSKFVELQLHPITLGFQTSRGDRGRPKLATGADATRILEMMTARSKAFGATVTVKGGVGVVTPTP